MRSILRAGPPEEAIVKADLGILGARRTAVAVASWKDANLFAID